MNDDLLKKITRISLIVQDQQQIVETQQKAIDQLIHSASIEQKSLKPQLETQYQSIEQLIKNATDNQNKRVDAIQEAVNESIKRVVTSQTEAVNESIKRAVVATLENHRLSVGQTVATVQKVAAWSMGGFLVVILLCIGFLIHDKNRLTEKNEALEDRVSQLRATLEGSAALEGKEDAASSSPGAEKLVNETVAPEKKPAPKKSNGADLSKPTHQRNGHAQKSHEDGRLL